MLAFRFQHFPFKSGRSRRFTPTLSFALCDFDCAPPLPSLFNCIEQSLPRQFAVLRLRARILHSDADSSRPMTQCHGSRHLIYILTARSGGPRKRFLKIDISNAEPRHALCKRIRWHLLSKIWLLASHNPQSPLRIPQLRQIASTRRKSVLKLPMAGLEPARAFYGPTDFKSVASAISPHRHCVPWSLSILCADRKRNSP